MTKPTTAAILKAVSNPHVDLYRAVGHGYWVFTYWNEAANVYDTESVYCVRLNDMSTQRWVEIGKRFAASVEAKAAERLT